MRLGSLFDGSGTAPLAATLLGWTPVWASEIESYPVAVTTARFPEMQHLGDITQINGAEAPPVDVIVGGSPCQDLSIAGKQAGLDGERSNLFYEMTRIIREMREATNGAHPRFVVWENVVGAFSSNKGRDFLAVVEAFCALADDAVHIPGPQADKRTGRLVWKNAGAVVGDGWSFAWRVLDAQYWGVPQRRRRIFALLDLGSERAGEILFERTRLPWDSEPSGEAGEGTPADAVGCAYRGGGAGRCYAIDALSSNSMKSANPHSGFHEEDYVKCLDTSDQNPSKNQGGNVIVQETVYALQGNGIDRAHTAGCNGKGWREGEMYTLNTIDRPAVVYDALGNGSGNVAAESGMHQTNCEREPIFWNGEKIAPTLTANNAGGNQRMPDKDNFNCVIQQIDRRHRYIVRRLTPTECARLQGFPDWWVDGVSGSDTAKYRMWGNGMALPCMLAVLNGIKEVQHRG